MMLPGLGAYRAQRASLRNCGELLRRPQTLAVRGIRVGRPVPNLPNRMLSIDELGARHFASGWATDQGTWAPRWTWAAMGSHRNELPRRRVQSSRGNRQASTEYGLYHLLLNSYMRSSSRGCTMRCPTQGRKSSKVHHASAT